MAGDTSIGVESGGSLGNINDLDGGVDLGVDGRVEAREGVAVAPVPVGVVPLVLVADGVHSGKHVDHAHLFSPRRRSPAGAGDALPAMVRRRLAAAADVVVWLDSEYAGAEEEVGLVGLRDGG